MLEFPEPEPVSIKAKAWVPSAQAFVYGGQGPGPRGPCSCPRRHAKSIKVEPKTPVLMPSPRHSNLYPSRHPLVPMLKSLTLAIKSIEVKPRSIKVKPKPSLDGLRLEHQGLEHRHWVPEPWHYGLTLGLCWPQPSLDELRLKCQDLGTSTKSSSSASVDSS